MYSSTVFQYQDSDITADKNSEPTITMDPWYKEEVYSTKSQAVPLLP